MEVYSHTERGQYNLPSCTIKKNSALHHTGFIYSHVKVLFVIVVNLFPGAVSFIYISPSNLRMATQRTTNNEVKLTSELLFEKPGYHSLNMWGRNGIFKSESSCMLT